MGHLVLPLQADGGGGLVSSPAAGVGTSARCRDRSGVWHILAQGAENPNTVHGFEMLWGWKHLLSRKATSGAK